MEAAAREKLARESMEAIERLVAAERKKIGLSKRVEIDELRSFAMEGLAAAIERYDPGRQVPFMAFARSRIQGAIYDGLSQTGWLPRRLHRRIAFYRKSEEMLRSYSTTPPPQDEVENVHRLADTLKELSTAYVTTYVAESENEPASSPAEADVVIDRKRFSARLKHCINELPEKQRQIVRGYYFEDLNLAQVAERMGISISWASRRLSSALKSLRRSFGEEELSEAVDTYATPPG